jgi:hypothetical protein
VLVIRERKEKKKEGKKDVILFLYPKTNFRKQRLEKFLKWQCNIAGRIKHFRT